jgi:hypothetical protein
MDKKLQIVNLEQAIRLKKTGINLLKNTVIKNGYTANGELVGCNFCKCELGCYECSLNIEYDAPTIDDLIYTIEKLVTNKNQ